MVQLVEYSFIVFFFFALLLLRDNLEAFYWGVVGEVKFEVHYSYYCRVIVCQSYVTLSQWVLLKHQWLV